jgi:hypothetical protein
MKNSSAGREADAGAERTVAGTQSPGPLLVRVSTRTPGRNFEARGLFYVSPCTSAERRQR